MGDNWPNNGEIDIMEGVNTQFRNQMTLHTAPGCTRDDGAKPAPGQSQAFSGTPLQASCDVTVNSNSGCGVMSTEANTFGEPFNNNGGGVAATALDSLGIRIWIFPHGTVPSDITAMAPNPITWRVPDAFFSSETCPVDEFFANMAIVFDITLCGYVHFIDFVVYDTMISSLLLLFFFLSEISRRHCFHLPDVPEHVLKRFKTQIISSKPTGRSIT